MLKTVEGMRKKLICWSVDQTGCATERKAGSGTHPRARRHTSRTLKSSFVPEVKERPTLEHPQIAVKLNISDRSDRVVKKDLHLTVFRLVPAQVVNDATIKQKRL